ncbi:sigma factor-like helix-turn-helix DNA-binding protein [Nonomuraea sp. NPDC046802]|uniref:sigma factor-like helix-turn-helix DNA-binding protein n=1 Tax=Nonomuraea sp. NPDC046802 TaxID=3154919 RepID=UPI0033CE76F9
MGVGDPSDRTGGEWRGQDDAAEQAFRQHENLLYSMAHSMLGDHDAAQAVVGETRAHWLAQSSAHPSRSPTGLVRLATVLALARLRTAQSKGESHIGPWLPEPLRDEPELVLAESVSAGISAVFDVLDADKRIVFLLRHAFGLSYADIAAMIGRPERSVRQLDTEAQARVRCEVWPPRYGQPPRKRRAHRRPGSPAEES